jgi:calcium-dependent protein kinase
MMMDHPNIIKLYEVFESDNSLYLIMEECYGGDLFSRISKRIEANDMYSEKEACEIIQQVLRAIEYCHNVGIVHRDLKPENLLYLHEGSEENNPIKIIDFGLSQSINLNKMLSSKVGTAYYVAPEILAGKYTEKCDIWSAGVILYILLSGEPPFNGPNDRIIYSKIKKMDYNFPDEKWKNISSEAKDLISKMLSPEAQRLSASQTLEHPWFNLVKDKKISLEKLNIGKDNFFKEYNESNQLKKIVLLCIASKLEENEINDLKKLFMAFDKDNNGQIDFKEFEQALMELKTLNLTQEEIQRLFNDI